MCLRHEPTSELGQERKRRVTPVTASSRMRSYLGIIAMTRLTAVQREEHEMTKFYCLIAAAAVFLPVALATMNQAAMIVA